MLGIEYVRKQREAFIGALISAPLANENEEIVNRESMGELFDACVEALTQNETDLLVPVLDGLINRAGNGKYPVLLNLSNQINLWFIKSALHNLAGDECRVFLKLTLPYFSFLQEYIANHQLGDNFRLIIDGLNRDSLERFDKSKSDFISIAAHELKTPLTLLEGYSDMLRELIIQKKVFDDHISLLLDGLDSGSRRLREIINDMIDVSLIENDLLSLSFQPTWIYKLLERINLELREALVSRSMSLKIERFPGDDSVNFYDGERLLQAIYNVITNAVKYTPDGGKIIISGRTIDEFIEIVVQDNGIGIDPMDQVKIFEKFQQLGKPALHSSGKIKFKGGGPGLGLPIAKGIIEAHGGRIWVESEGYDEERCPGSAFHILLPMRLEAPERDLSLLFGRMALRNQKREMGSG